MVSRRRAILAGALMAALLGAGCGNLHRGPFARPSRTPSASPTQTTPTARQTSYVVQPGDTLYSIATRFGITTDALRALNSIPNPDRIEVGTRLTLPAIAQNAASATPGGDPCVRFAAIADEIDGLLRQLRSGTGDLHSISQTADELSNELQALPRSFAGYGALGDAVGAVAAGAADLGTGHIADANAAINDAGTRLSDAQVALPTCG